MGVGVGVSRLEVEARGIRSDGRRARGGAWGVGVTDRGLGYGISLVGWGSGGFGLALDFRGWDFGSLRVSAF